MAAGVTRRARRDLLVVYLNDHLAGATAVAEPARRTAAAAEPGTEAASTLKALAAEITADRDALIEIMAALTIPVRRYKVLAAWAGEHPFRPARA